MNKKDEETSDVVFGSLKKRKLVEHYQCCQFKLHMNKLTFHFLKQMFLERPFHSVLVIRT